MHCAFSQGTEAGTYDFSAPNNWSPSAGPPSTTVSARIGGSTGSGTTVVAVDKSVELHSLQMRKAAAAATGRQILAIKPGGHLKLTAKMKPCFAAPADTAPEDTCQAGYFWPPGADGPTACGADTGAGPREDTVFCAPGAVAPRPLDPGMCAVGTESAATRWGQRPCGDAALALRVTHAQQDTGRAETESRKLLRNRGKTPLAWGVVGAGTTCHPVDPYWTAAFDNRGEECIDQTIEDAVLDKAINRVKVLRADGVTREYEHVIFVSRCTAFAIAARLLCFLLCDCCLLQV